MTDHVDTIWDKIVRYQLKLKYPIVALLLAITILFSYYLFTGLKVYTDFFELYPPDHKYIKLYKEYRKMFGSANVMSLILERKDGKDIYHPDTMAKINQLTLGILKIRGVNPLQVASVTHPKVKQVVIGAYGIGVFPLSWPAVGYPKTQKECDTFRKTVYAQEGIRGFYVALDDKSVVVYAGFWEEGLDFGYLFKKIKALTASVEDESHACYATGYPMLYAWMDYYKFHIMAVLLVTLATMLLLLLCYFRNLRGVMIPVISGILSALWGLGFASMMGFSIDPLLLVVPVLLSARALSHSCQCLERYNQEYFILGNKENAIVKSYSHMYSAAMLAIVTDGLGVLTIAIATIPLMRKLAFISSFWIITIFIAVVILNPIILAFLPPPKKKGENLNDAEDYLEYLATKKKSGKGFGSKIGAFGQRCYEVFTEIIWKASGPKYKWYMFTIIMVLLIGGGIYTSTQLKIGDSSAGGAILYADHPYNIAAGKMNQKFVGASRLIVVIKGKQKGAIKDRHTLEVMENLASYMSNNIENVGGTLSITDMVRRINRMYHDGSPKWEIIPQKKYNLGQIFFLFASNMAPGEMDQFVSLPDYDNASVTAFFREYNNDVIKTSIAKVQEFADELAKDPNAKVEIKLASGILGILAAVNEEVEWSYWAILIVIFSVTFMLCALNYRSLKTALILLIPLYVSQVLCELIMIILGIDLNIDSLPVAAIGVGVGIDYAIYYMSRLVEESKNTSNLDTAILISLRTTGRIIIFTATTLSAGVFFWLFSPLKFQAEMGLLILLLMIFNMIGALVFLPTLAAVLRPRWVVEMEERQTAQAA